MRLVWRSAIRDSRSRSDMGARSWTERASLTSAQIFSSRDPMVASAESAGHPSTRGGDAAAGAAGCLAGGDREREGLADPGPGPAAQVPGDLQKGGPGGGVGLVEDDRPSPVGPLPQ